MRIRQLTLKSNHNTHQYVGWYERYSYIEGQLLVIQIRVPLVYAADAPKWCCGLVVSFRRCGNPWTTPLLYLLLFVKQIPKRTNIHKKSIFFFGPRSFYHKNRQFFFYFLYNFSRMAQKFHKNQQTQIYIDILFMICIPPFIFSSLLAILSNIPTVQYLLFFIKKWTKSTVHETQQRNLHTHKHIIDLSQHYFYLNFQIFSNKTIGRNNLTINFIDFSDIKNTT